MDLPLCVALLCLFGAWFCHELRAYVACRVPAGPWYAVTGLRARSGRFVLVAWGHV